MLVSGITTNLLQCDSQSESKKSQIYNSDLGGSFGAILHMSVWQDFFAALRINVDNRNFPSVVTHI